MAAVEVHQEPIGGPLVDGLVLEHEAAFVTEAASISAERNS